MANILWEQDLLLLLLWVYKKKRKGTNGVKWKWENILLQFIYEDIIAINKISDFFFYTINTHTERNKLIIEYEIEKKVKKS